MATRSETPETPESLPPSALELIAETLAALKASQPTREIGFSDPDYQARMRAETKAFKTPTFQNGIDVDAAGLSDEIIERVAHLKAGRYLGGIVEVDVSHKGAVNFRYKNKTPDQRMALQTKFGSFEELVNKIWNEMQEQKSSAA